ncbi:Fungal specific transcription factor domain-containing protein 44 [Elsinoe fawcettii]|nr:Fungal specific transcription factor domain-containing protein 44 [Elsinoe fawcettii]
MHEDTSVQTPLSPFMEDSLSMEQKLGLVDVYLKATSGLVDVLTRAEAAQLIRDHDRPEMQHNACKGAMADLVLAIGAQCSKLDPSLVEVEKFFFNRGQQRAFSTMLRNPSIEMIAVFLLMSFYMLGACHRNAASMYLGVASRAATVLGLQHQDAYLSVTNEERQQQLRTWMSLRILDLLVSAILARPSSAPAAGSSDNLFALLESDNDDRRDLVAQYSLVKIIDQIVDKVYGQKGVSPATAEAFLDHLKKWSDALPEGLQSQGMMVNHQNPAKTLSSLHLACTYYFAVTLATRPFLINTLTARMARLSNGVPNGFAVQEHPVHAELASVCVDSAVWMIRACLEANRSDLLLANMQLMKAFVFAAALILGFSLFAQLEVDLETDAMFAGARDILQSFSARSSQAAHYYEILSSLTQTIHRQRQQFAMQSRRRSNAYVGQLFKTAEPEPPPQLDQTLAESSTDDINSLINTAKFSDLDMWMQNQPIFNNLPESTDMVGADLLGWDSLDLGLWDNFPYMNQPN